MWYFPTNATSSVVLFWTWYCSDHGDSIREHEKTLDDFDDEIIIPRKGGYCNHLRVSVCLFVCLFVSRISQKRLVGFWWNLVSREVMIIGRTSSKLGVIRIEIRIWDPDNCFSWTTGRILEQDFNQIQDNSNLIIVIWWELLDKYGPIAQSVRALC